MQWELTHNDQIISLQAATEMEIEQIKLSFTKEAANATHC